MFKKFHASDLVILGPIHKSSPVNSSSTEVFLQAFSSSGLPYCGAVPSHWKKQFRFVGKGSSVRPHVAINRGSLTAFLEEFQKILEKPTCLVRIAVMHCAVPSNIALIDRKTSKDFSTNLSLIQHLSPQSSLWKPFLTLKHQQRCAGFFEIFG